MSHQLAILAFIALLSGCATSLESVYVPADSLGWKLGSSSDRRGQTIAEYVPSNESINNWSKLLTIQFLEGERRNPTAVMEDLKALMKARCPNSYWGVIAQNSTSTLYEWKITNCSANPDQHEIARLLRGNDGEHRIAYTEKTNAMNPATREKWIASFKEAYVLKGGKKVVLAP